MSRRGAARLGWGLAAFSLALSLVGEGLSQSASPGTVGELIVPIEFRRS